MKIAVIGAGNVGGALARKWASVGHQILIGTKDPSTKQDWNNIENITVHISTVAAQQAETILIALPVPAIVPVAKEIGDLTGKVIIDATNSVFAKPNPYPNGLEALKDLTGAEVVKGFNTTGFENMADPVYDGTAVDMFMAGTSEKGKSVMSQLAVDAGFANCYDFGGDDKTALIEQFAMAWINLAIMQGEGRNLAFKVLKR